MTEYYDDLLTLCGFEPEGIDIAVHLQQSPTIKRSIWKRKPAFPFYPWK
jgi:hypothetical protein